MVRVDIGEDLLTAKVYVSILGTDAEQRLGLKALEHAAGYIQDLMGRQIRLRHTPILEFELDTRFKKTLETLDIIEHAMNEIRQKEPIGGEDRACQGSSAGAEGEER